MKSILIVTILLFSSVAFAQEDDKDLSKQIITLNKEIENKDKRISKLETEVHKLEQALSVSDSLLRFEKEQSKTAMLKKQISELQQDTANLTIKYKAEIEKIKQEKQNVIDNLQKRHQNDIRQIDSLKEELKSLAHFQKEMFAQMVAEVDNNWLTKPFAMIDSITLVNTLNRYDRYSTENQSVKESFYKLRKIYTDFVDYKNAIAALNNVFNGADVNRLKKSISEIRKTTTIEQNKIDLKKIYNQLEDYKVTVDIFQEIISAIDEKIKKELGKETPNKIGLTASIEAYIAKQERDYKYISAINEIPYLSRVFAEYEAALKEDCFSNKVEIIANKIKSINTEK